MMQKDLLDEAIYSLPSLVQFSILTHFAHGLDVFCELHHQSFHFFVVIGDSLEKKTGQQESSINVEDEHASVRSIKTLMAATGALNGVPSKKDATLCENSARVFHASERFSFVFETP